MAISATKEKVATTGKKPVIPTRKTAAASKTTPGTDATKTTRARPTPETPIAAERKGEDNTARNLRLLNAILNNTEDKKATTVPARRPKAVFVSTTTKLTRGAATVKSKDGRNTATDVQPEEPQDFPESAVEQKKLAMNCFNSSLKVLSLVVKQRQAKKNAYTESKSRASSLSIVSEKTGSAQESDQTEAIKHADCAGVALDVLRKLDSDKGHPSDAASKREQGAIVLLDKLISLELKDQAHLAASKIHEQYWKKRRGSRRENAKAGSQRLHSLAELIEQDDSLAEKRDCDMLCSLQSQLLRLVILMAPTAIDYNFVRAISVDTKGSPAAMVVRSLEAGHLDQQRAGETLRTISQALAKVYAILVKHPNISKTTDKVAFKLIAEVYSTKIVSWNLLDHKPDIGKELWSILDRAVRRFWIDKPTKDDLKYEITLSCLECVQNQLRRYSFSSELSTKIASFISQLAEVNNDAEKSIDLLSNLALYSKGNEKLAYLCRLNATQLEGGGFDNTMLESTHDLIDVFRHLSGAMLPLTADQLLSVVRLRKACSSQLSRGIASNEDIVPELNTNCLRLLSVIHNFCVSHWSAENANSSRLHRSLRLAILKTTEAIIDAEAVVATAQHSLLNEYLTNIDACRALISHSRYAEETLAEDSTQAQFLHSLKVRLSNVFWRAHVTQAEFSTDASLPAIELAQRSIACLLGLSVEELSKAALGPRLEKLATLQQAANQTEQAQTSLTHAVKHYIASGALTDAVEASLSKRHQDVWNDPTSAASQLGRALNARITLTINQEDTIDPVEGLFNDETLPDIHQAVLLEHQIFYLLKKKPTKAVFEALLEQEKYAINLSCAPQYHAWRLRLVSAFLFRASKIPDLEDSQIAKLAGLAQDVLAGSADAQKMFLKQLTPILETQLRIQLQLVNSEMGAAELMTCLSRLQEIIFECTDMQGLEQTVDDIECLQYVLRAVSEQFMALFRHREAISCLKPMHHIMKCALESDEQSMARCLVNMARCYLSLDSLDSAKSSLEEAKVCLSAMKEATAISIDFHLTLADYYLRASHLEKSQASISEAGKAFLLVWPPGSDLNSGKQIERDGIVAKAALLMSCLAARRGDSQHAPLYARQAAKITTSIWSALENRYSRSATSLRDDSTIGNLADDFSKLQVESRPSHVLSAIHGPKFWPFLRVYVNSLKHIGSLLSQAGLFEDALHYYKQLRNLNGSHGAESILPQLATLYAKAGRCQEGSDIFNSCQAVVQKSQHLITSLDLSKCAQASIELGQSDVARELVRLIRDRASDQGQQRPAAQDRVKPRRGVSKSKVIKAPPKRKNTVSNQEETESAKEQHHVAAVISNRSFDEQILEDRLRSLESRLAKGSAPHRDSSQKEKTIAQLCVSAQPLVLELFATVEALLAQAWQQLCGDSMASVLTDSAVALPARTVARGRPRRVSFYQCDGDSVDLSPSKRTIPQPKADNAGHFHHAAHKLQSALRIINVLARDRQPHCSTEMIHALVKMEARISLLLTTMNLPFAISSTELVLKASQPKDDALERERMIAAAECATQDRASLAKWPTRMDKSSHAASAVTPKQLNELPTSWSVLSLTVSEDGDELIISKILSGRSPFLVRIPLRRSNEGGENDEFVFADALHEMGEIIEQANTSSHDLRGTGDKTTRAQWHADREIVDKRLESLLQNIEFIWLGGFRGMLSPYHHSEKVAKDFGRALAQSLDNHLPSRQKTGTNVADGKIEIHEHILEIFLGLGNPDENDLDDAIMDLLYFVADILQFNGERNAYDEIDWDAMLVDALDALRACHESQTIIEPHHMILVLDKELECFPWEALPCLIDHPVSRMPSLATIFDRLAAIHTQSSIIENNSSPLAYTVSSTTTQTAYILNPSSDLPTTQSLFSPILQSHLSSPSTHTLTAKPPTESQFSHLLTTSSVLLYLGHGSGAQYIRPRTIRSLPQCAVTLLFGCSSAKMKTHGKFESSGMPRAYMLGGSMAVVGCLWDVTDRELDRVALKTLASWGLVDDDDQQVKEGLKRKGRKGAKKQQEAVRGSKQVGIRKRTLVEAVRDGREACALRYLCGAAVVVYGVPVVLD